MRNVLRNVLIIILILIPSLASSIMTYRGYRTLPEPLPTSEGELIYQEMGCVMCHGIQGNGDGFLAEGLNPKPRDFTSYEQMNRVADLQMEEAIRNGITGTGMPAFPQLTDHQLNGLVVYLRSFLAETYLTVNMCVTDTFIVDAEKEEAHFRIEVDNPDIIQAVRKGKLIHITANWRAFLALARKVTRTHIRVIEESEDEKGQKERDISLITVRVHRCIR